MKKLLLLFVLSLTILFLHAGYVIRGINALAIPEDLKNYTLTINYDGKPISAASLHTTNAPGNGKNTIVVIPSDPTVNPVFFPITLTVGPGESFNIEVRDFHYDVINNRFVLCGSRETAFGSYAFVAVINGGLTLMRYNEYIEADKFYSICVPNDQGLGYYVAGKTGNNGALASVDRINLQIINFFVTEDAFEWEYHKIIAVPNSSAATTFYVSGRDPHCTQIGFSTFNPAFTSIRNYFWYQPSEPASLCVVSDIVMQSNRIVIASSSYASLILNPVPLPVSLVFPISSYHYNFISTPDTKYLVQDIRTILQEDGEVRFSVAGYMTDVPMPVRTLAWHGYVLGLSSAISMTNNYYYGTSYEQYKHYKIRYDLQGNEYTGGYFQGNVQGNFSMCALFGSPLRNAPYCDHHLTGTFPDLEHRYLYQFQLTQSIPQQHNYMSFPYYEESMPVYLACTPFKGEFPEYSMLLPETETEITNFYDRITVKDTPLGTSYQIYSVTGQLIQSGTTNPDISTAQLSMGIYILRLENGKAFKFVK